MRGRGARNMDGPATGKPPGADRDLDAGQGRQREVERTRETAADVGTWSGSHSQVAEAGGWRVETMSKWTEFCSGRVRAERLQEKEDTTTNATNGGALG